LFCNQLPLFLTCGTLTFKNTFAHFQAAGFLSFSALQAYYKKIPAEIQLFLQRNRILSSKEYLAVKIPTSNR